MKWWFTDATMASAFRPQEGARFMCTKWKQSRNLYQKRGFKDFGGQYKCIFLFHSLSHTPLAARPLTSPISSVDKTKACSSLTQQHQEKGKEGSVLSIDDTIHTWEEGAGGQVMGVENSRPSILRGASGFSSCPWNQLGS